LLIFIKDLFISQIALIASLKHMKKIIYFGMFVLVACSPYKKIVIPMSKIQTDNWIDKSEAVVISKLGPYKTKSLNETG